VKPWPLRPYIPYGNGNNDTHFFHDVTGDGLADIIAYRPSVGGAPGTVKLWVNVDGRTYRCANATDCVVATIVGADQPAAGIVSAYRVAFTDFDGDGTEDFVLLGNTGVWHFSFLAVPPVPAAGLPGTRSPRPGLLTRIRNGVGAETEVVYQTVQELERNFTDPTPNSFRAPWTTHSPVVIPVVTRITTRDSRVVAGAAPVEPYQVDRSTRFEYRDPAYDPWERSFKGWGRVRATDRAEVTVQTWFWFSACESGGFTGGCPGGSDMATDKALVGAAVRVDRFVANAPGRPTHWLSTTTRLTRDVDPTRVFLTPPPPSSAPADRNVLFAAVQEENTYLYDTSLPVSQVNQIRRPDEFQDVPLQSGSERRLRTTIKHDDAGNAATVTRWGHVQLGGSLLAIDPIVRTTTTFDATSGCKAAWACLPTDVKVFGDLETNSLAPLLRRSLVAYDANTGDVTSVSADLQYPDSGSWASLWRPVGTSAPKPASASTAAGPKQLRVLTHDAYGNVTRSVGQLGPSRPCTTTKYDRTYHQFPATVAVYAGDACTGVSQGTSLVFDRGLGAQSAAMFANQTMQTAEFDAFGRVSAIYAPAPDAGSATELAVQIGHHTTSPVSWTEIRRRVDHDRVIASIEIVNGIGEPVLAFDQADPTADGAPWIARSWTERDVNGVPTNGYRPWFYTGNAYNVAA
ncbi:MAG: FG-GAP-like repeat-containing protein, partial [Actinomycetota bacterium]|nr:FG-GAP-like repeat-containing protein [Actinomycetota bacterium]